MTWRTTATGSLVGVALVGLASLVVRLLHAWVPYSSNSVVYLPAVIAVASLFGLGAGLVTSVVAMFAFNILFLPPRFTVTLQDSRNWVALAIFIVAGAVTAELAARARRRALEAHEREREAALLAGMSSALVGGATLERAQADAAGVAAAAIGASGARIVLGRGPLLGQELALPLEVDGRVIGRLELRGATPSIASSEQARRVARSLAGLLALAEERERLAAAKLEAEALRRSDALKTALLRAVSHELRSPLTAIKTTVSALLGRDLQLDRATALALLEDVESETDRLGRLVDDLLDLSRLQASSVVTSPDWCEVGDLVRGAVHEARARLADRRIDVAEAGDVLLVHVDAAQVERVLVNLLENAAKYSPPGDAVEVEAAQETDGAVDILITDHGPGIAREDRDRVFMPFYRSRTAGQVAGTGLGLAIARGFVEANGGTLEIVDGPRGGTRMRVRLPAAPIAAAVVS